MSDQGVAEAGLDVLQKPFAKLSLIRKVREMLDAEENDSDHSGASSLDAPAEE
jgi:hypothetical protein